MWQYIAKSAIGVAIPKIINGVVDFFSEESKPKPQPKRKYNSRKISVSVTEKIIKENQDFIMGKLGKLGIHTQTHFYTYLNQKYKLNKSNSAIRAMIKRVTKND